MTKLIVSDPTQVGNPDHSPGCSLASSGQDTIKEMAAEQPFTRSLQVQMLLSRLERISADSSWAHQASGVRASLARMLSETIPDPEKLDGLIDLGYDLLNKAASEIPAATDTAEQ